MAQSLETPPTRVIGESPTTNDWERDEKAWNVPRPTALATVPDSVSHATHDEELDWKSFVATYFSGTRRHNFKPIIAYSDYRRSLRVSQHSATEPDAEAPSIQEWENEGGAPSVGTRR